MTDVATKAVRTPVETITEVEELLCATEDTIPSNVRRKLQNSLSEFVHHQALIGRPVVCVTSGGTTVPLERNVIRFVIHQLE